MSNKRNDYKGMRDATQLEQITFPDSDINENFTFDAVTQAGTFTFHFKWLNDRWNAWVTLPDGTVREAAGYPNVIQWTGHSDYGLVFKTELTAIDYNSLFDTELILITWA